MKNEYMGICEEFYTSSMAKAETTKQSQAIRSRALFERLLRSARKWRGIAVICPIIIAFSSIIQAQNITEVEYFFNTDPGVGMGSKLAVSQDSVEISFVGTIDASKLEEGIQVLYIRAKNANSVWGLPIKQLVLVDQGQAVQVSEIEYYCNTDPGVGLGTSFDISDSTTVTLLETVDASALPSGLHNLYIRAQSADGVWGLPIKQLVLIDENDPQAPALITAAEYFFDVDPGVGNALSVELEDLSTVEESVSFNADSLTAGTHRLFVRVMDEYGAWSLIINQVIEIIDVPELESQEVDSLIYVENSGPIPVTDSLLVVTDTELQVDSALIWVENGFLPDQDVLTIETPITFIKYVQEESRIIKIIGEGTAEEYQTMLRSLKFENTSDFPADTLKKVSFRVYGTADSSRTLSRYIDIEPVDDPLTQIMDFPFIELPEDLQDTTFFNLSEFFLDVDNPTNYSIKKLGEPEEIRFTLIDEREVRLSVDENWFGFDSLQITAKSGPITLVDTMFIEIYPVFEVPPTSPEILAPTQNSEIDLRAFLIWSLSEDTVGNRFPIPLYQLQIDTTSTFSSPMVDQQNIGIPNGLLNTKSSTFSTLQASNDEDSVFAIRLSSIEGTDLLSDNGKYYWRVRAFNEDSASVWSEAWNFWLNLENDAPFAITEGFTPADSITISSVNQVLSWNAGSDPDFSDTPNRLRYIVELSSENEFTQTQFIDTTALGVNSVQADSLSDEAIYFWRVKARDDDGVESDWSAAQAFIINQKLDPPNPFELLSPLNTVDTLTSTPTFVWQSTSDSDLFDYVTYRYRISSDSMFNEVIFEGVIQADTTFIPETDLDIGTYFWQVAAVDTDSLVTWASNSESEPFSFEIIQKVSNEMASSVPKDFTLNQNYPNPFNPSSTIQFGIPEASNVRLEVFNLLGRKVSTLVAGDKLQAGWHTVQFDAGNIASGVYIYRIEAGNFVQTKRMMLIK